jgi:hypothetical protein
MSDVTDAVTSTLGTVGKVLGKAAWEGAKIFGGTAKAAGGDVKEIVKESLKGAAKGLEALGKSVLEK